MNLTVMPWLARRLGCTEGQAWTVLLGGALAVVLSAAGLPGTLGNDVAHLAAVPLAAPDAVPPVTVPPVVVAPAPGQAGVAPPLDLQALALAPTPVVLPLQDASSGPRWTPLVPQVPTAGLLDAGWGYAGTGTPIDDLERALVPAGALPVTVRAGAVNKVSFLRLRLPGAMLRLVPVQDAGANQLESAAAVVVCPVITPGWRGRDGEDLRTAPRYDCSLGRARSGVVKSDTSWVFDLSAIPSYGGVREFALVPAGTASDFQVVFGRPGAP